MSVAVVAPEIFPPLERFDPPFLHWYVNDVPVAVTEKLADEPGHAD